MPWFLCKRKGLTGGKGEAYEWSMMTLDELKVLAADKGIKITPKGYKTDGIFYRIESWPEMIAMLSHHDPVGSQLAGWLKAAR